MQTFKRYSRKVALSVPFLMAVFLAGCSGGQDPLLGTGGVDTPPVIIAAPTVTAVFPALNATGVPINSKTITATFSKAMDTLTLTPTSFTLACPVGTPVTGPVTYDDLSKTATLTLPALPDLPPGVICTATVTTAAKDATALPLAGNFAWTFTTGATADVIKPTVVATGAYGATGVTSGATGVPINWASTATFSEEMDPVTIANTANFTVVKSGGAAVVGTVTYLNKIATFTPAANLEANTLYTSTITNLVKDAAGNSMAVNYVWSWTTAAIGDTVAPTVTLTNPVDGAIAICTNKTANATFSEPMDAATILAGSNFKLALTSTGVLVPGLVTYDSLTRIASFNPTADLTLSQNYTATIKGGITGVKDVAGNALAVDRIISFTIGGSACPTLPALGAAAPFGGIGGNSTITNDGLNTIVNGDLAVNASATTVTGFRDSSGAVYTVTTDNDGTVTGLIHTAGPVTVLARSNAVDAFNAISPAGIPGGIDVSSLAQCPSCGGAGQGPGQLAGRTLPPGVYKSTSGTFGIGITPATAADLTLDAGGDANAVWVFQTADLSGTLTVGVTGPATPAVPIKVLLVNGAQAKNVFWYVPGGASIGTGSTMVGTLIADASITISTTGGSPPTAVPTILNGRAIALTGGVTMTNTIINVPAP